MSGEQGLTEAVELHGRLLALLSAGADVVLDLSQAEHLSGAVIQALLVCQRAAVAGGRSIRITEVPSKIHQAFTIMGLERWLESVSRPRE